MNAVPPALALCGSIVADENHAVWCVKYGAGYLLDSNALRTFTPIDLWDVRLRAGGAAELPLPDGHTTAVLIVSGSVKLNGEREASEGDLAIFHRSGHGIALEASNDSTLLIMAGEPIDEPIVGSGPFVLNTREEITQAFKDFQSGRMGKIPG